MVLGVTGGYCAGKDAAVAVLARHGIIEINEDRIGHEALRTLKERVAEEFGSRVLNADGEINRRVLGSIVFENHDALKRLEGIVHPPMVAETKRRIADAGNRHVMINAAILHRMGLHRLCDLVLVIRAPFFLRFYRAMKRDRLGIRETVKRLLTQASQRENIDLQERFLNEKGEYVDTVVVQNCGTKSSLSRKLAAIVSELGITGR